MDGGLKATYAGLEGRVACNSLPLGERGLCPSRTPAMEAKAGTLESPWRKGMFGRVSQKIYGRAGKGTVQKIKKMK